MSELPFRVCPGVSFARRRQILALSLLVGISPVCSTPAIAQAVADPERSNSTSSDQVGDIVVTAQRREERLQDVPITISAFTADTLAKSGVSSSADLGTLVPGLVFSSVVGYANPYLRGVGTTATGPGQENPIATYVDGVYVASQSAGLLSLSNIESIEVDKGPQGTLFGRNATGGAIQIRTLTPSTTPSMTASLGYGNYNTIDATLYATTGLAPDLAADFAVAFNRQGDGYAKNLANGEDVDKTRDILLRAKIHYEFDALTSLTIAADYGHTTGVPTLAPAPGTIPQFNPPLAPKKRDVYGFPQPYLMNSQWGVSATLQHDFDFAKLTSITAYRDTYVNSQFDTTLTAVPGTIFYIFGTEPHKQITQELQLSSNGDGPLKWVAGAYIFSEHAGYLEPTTIGGDSFALSGIPSGILQYPDNKTFSAAAFGQGTYAFGERTNLTLGLRYTYEKRKNRFINVLPDFGSDGITDISGELQFKNLSWRVALDHKFAEGVMAYASYNRGYKSGLFNSGLPVFPEQLDAFEAGLKSTLFDQRLRLNLSGFYYLYKNIQTVSYPNGNLVITNGAKATLYGLDADFEAVITPDLRLSGGLEVLHTNYDSFPTAPISVPVPGGGTTYVASPGGATGNSLGHAPKFTANISADYIRTLGAVKTALNVTYSYNDGWFAEADNRLRQPAYSLLNASFTVGSLDNDISVKFWGKNLLNEDYAVALAAQTNGDFIQWATPRTYGVSVTKRF